MRELKQSASNLEDENRELREKLRFKSDAYEFRNPFWSDKANADRQELGVMRAETSVSQT